MQTTIFTSLFCPAVTIFSADRELECDWFGMGDNQLNLRNNRDFNEQEPADTTTLGNH